MRKKNIVFDVLLWINLRVYGFKDYVVNFVLYDVKK